jgi:hypothetical protein
MPYFSRLKLGRTAGIAIALLAATGLVAGCGSSGGGTGQSRGPASGSHSVKPSQKGAPNPKAEAEGSLHGIVLATMTGQNTVQLQALSPATGAVTQTRTFTGGSASLALNTSDPGFVWQQAFDRNFTKVAATGPQAADGSQSVGVVNDKGVYTPLTASTSGGYGTTLQKNAIGFNPGTGDLWYQTPQGNGSDGGQFGYVNLRTGRDTLIKNSSGFQNGVVGGENDRVYFAPDGHGVYAPIDILAHTDQVYLPSGSEVQRDAVDNGYKVSWQDNANDMTPDTQITGMPWSGVPWMSIPVDSHRFLGTEVNGNQLYVGILGKSVVNLRPLLPDSNRSVGEIVVSPDHTQVAFVSTDAGGQNELFVASLSAIKGQPRQLSAFNGNLGEAYGLLAWNN